MMAMMSSNHVCEMRFRALEDEVTQRKHNDREQHAWPQRRSVGRQAAQYDVLKRVDAAGQRVEREEKKEEVGPLASGLVDEQLLLNQGERIYHWRGVHKQRERDRQRARDLSEDAIP